MAGQPCFFATFDDTHSCASAKCAHGNFAESTHGLMVRKGRAMVETLSDGVTEGRSVPET